jgi:hypothetical protein
MNISKGQWSTCYSLGNYQGYSERNLYLFKATNVGAV